MTQNANGAVTNRQENTQLFSEGSLGPTDKKFRYKNSGQKLLNNDH